MIPSKNIGLSTKLLHNDYLPMTEHGAVIPPLHLSTTFEFGNDRQYEYARSGNPTRDVLEATLANIDNATHALAYSSGSAALANVMALLAKGEEILFSADAYGGTYRYIVQVLGRQGILYHVVDFNDFDAVEQKLVTHNIKVVWAETPTNPLLKVVDIARLADVVHAHDALLAVDNTFATPVIQRPLDLGADIVAYSTTKYMNGHSDSVGGSLALRDEELYERLKFLQNAIGAIMSPFDAWLTLRGLRTLELRMERHVQNAQAIAELLVRSSYVEKVYYPGFFEGEQAKIVSRQMRLPGGIVSVDMRAGIDIKKFVGRLQYFPLAESLGGVESLIDHPASMTHAAIPKMVREKIGLSDGLLRISVGIENTDDLVRDMSGALEGIGKEYPK